MANPVLFLAPPASVEAMPAVSVGEPSLVMPSQLERPCNFFVRHFAGGDEFIVFTDRLELATEAAGITGATIRNNSDEGSDAPLVHVVGRKELIGPRLPLQQLYDKVVADVPGVLEGLPATFDDVDPIHEWLRDEAGEIINHQYFFDLLPDEETAEELEARRAAILRSLGELGIHLIEPNDEPLSLTIAYGNNTMTDDGARALLGIIQGEVDRQPIRSQLKRTRIPYSNGHPRQSP